MATAKMPFGAEAAKGSVGQTTATVYRGTNVLKRRPYPSNPKSARQLAVRAFQTTVSRAWAALTDANRLSWETFASLHQVPDKFGTMVTRSGFNLYCGFGALLLDMGKALVATAPVAIGPIPLAGLAPTPGSGQCSFAWTARGGTADTVDIWDSGVHTAGRTPSINNAKHIAFKPGETTPGVVTGLAPGLHTFWLRVISESDGQSSPFVQCTATIS
jgi:hypothetical protein